MHRIALADEQPVIRHAVRMVLEQEGYEVVLEAGDGVDALQGALKVKPDLLITALRLRRMGGLEVLRRVHEQRPRTKVLVLTEHDSEHVIKLIIQAGASGFVSKQEDLAELRFALRALERDHSYFPARALASADRPALQTVEVEQLRSLSPRELTVLYYLASGYTNKAIASELSLNDRTVSTHKARLFRKLNVRNMIELAEVARRHDFLGPGPGAETTPTPPWMAGGKGYSVLRSVLNAIPGALAINDLEGHLLFVNDYVMERYANVVNPEGMRITDLNVLTPELTRELEQVFFDAVKENRSFVHDAVLEIGGETRIKRFLGGPILDEQKRPVATVCVMRDLDEQEQTLGRLRDAKERADAGNRVKNALLARIATQLRGPVEALGAVLAPFEDGNDLSADNRARLEGALEATGQLRRLLDNLDVLTEMNNVAAQLVPEPCHVAKLTMEICAGEEKRLRQSDPAIRVDVDAANSSVLWLDAQRYRQLLVKLLAHAMAHAQRERLDVRLSAASKAGALVAMQLDIKESGAVAERGHGAARLRNAEHLDAARELALSLSAELSARQGASGVELRVTLMVPRVSA